jgi:uncharacterized protein YigA (DUF484 family)
MNDTEKLGAHEVAAWLRRHPQFLKQFPDLALSLVVPRDDGPAASLASYQLEVLRDKNRELSRRLQELFANAQENERLAVRTHQLALALMRQDNAADTLRAMAASLAEDFSGDLVRIVLFERVAGLDDVDWLQVIAALGTRGYRIQMYMHTWVRPLTDEGRMTNDEGWPAAAGLDDVDWLQAIPAGDARLAAFRDAIADGEPICGRLHPDKHALLYGMRGEEVQSSAMLSIPGVGLVTVGSREPNRFFPGMGTLFLRMMGEALAVALKRYER